MVGNRFKWSGKGSPCAGYTLMEMLVVVSLLGILASIAIPSYRDYVIRGKLPEATANLASKRVQMEQYFQDNHTYDGVSGLQNACVTDITTSNYFMFGCSVQSQTTYTLVATGIHDMAGFSFSIDQGGAKRTLQVPSGWSLPNPNNCWVTKRGGAC